MTQAEAQGTALGAFLRTRRDRLTPEEVGLAPGAGARRTPGLRREEVAAVAGISIDYYIRLERGRERHPSVGVIDALARALRLDDDERQHLRELAASLDGRDPTPASRSTRHVRQGPRLILEQLRPYPAYLTNRIGDVLAWNVGAEGLLVGLADWPVTQRNIARYAFLHPGARELYADWERQVTGLVSGLRRQASVDPEAPDLRDLVGELLVKSPEFAKLWDRYDVEHYREGRKRLHHPIVGSLDARFQVMELAGTDGQYLLSYHAAPGSPEYDAYLLLDRLTDSDARDAERLPL